MINRRRKDISTNPKHTIHSSVTHHERWMILDQNSLKGKDYPFRLSLMEFVRKKNVSNSDEYTVQRDSIYPSMGWSFLNFTTVQWASLFDPHKSNFILLYFCQLLLWHKWVKGGEFCLFIGMGGHKWENLFYLIWWPIS